MSYDIDVFSAEEPAAPAAQEGRGWQIAVDGPLRVEPEDIPAQVRSLLPGIRFLTQFHLEGDAPASARKTVATAARELARAARGVVVDQQAGTVETPRGVQRFEVARDWSGGDLLQLSWFVQDVAPLISAVSTTVLDTVQRTLPEFLPRRYGLFEPPQHKLETDGLDHCRQFIEAHARDNMVWYCHKPGQHVFVSIPDRVGATPRGFRCGRLTLNVDGKAAGDPAWRTELTRLWLEVADLIHPFYAEIRREACPTTSWWWNGIPAGSPSAVLIGEPYVELWPDFAASARTSPSGLRYVEQFVEKGAGGVPSPPPRIARPADPAKQTLVDLMAAPIRYPDVWPFEGPR